MNSLHVVAALGEIAVNLSVAHRLVRSYTRDVGDAETFERRVARVCARSDPEIASLLAHAGLECRVSFLPSPERLGRHPHQDVVGFAGHEVSECGGDGLANQPKEVQEVFIGAQVGGFDEETPAVEGDTGWPHLVEVVFDDRVGRRQDHADLCSVSNNIRHPKPPKER